MPYAPVTAEPGQQRWACVLDPTLAWSRFGLPLARGLAEVMEVWVAPELWHILENPRHYIDHPDLLRPDAATAGGPGVVARVAADEEIAEALRGWERLCITTDLARRKLFWTGGEPGESLLPPGVDPGIVWRCRVLAQALDARLGAARETPPWAAAFRDSAALVVARGSAFILTSRPAGDAEPAICVMFARWGIPCVPLPAKDRTVDLERERLRRLMVDAGLAKLLWAGLTPAVLHLDLPRGSVLQLRAGAEDEARLSDTAPGVAEPAPAAAGPWAAARGFWYAL